MKSLTYSAIKKQEAKSRMTGAQQARKNSQQATALQRQVSLVGEGSKWQITNLRQVAAAMAKWG